MITKDIKTLIVSNPSNPDFWVNKRGNTTYEVPAVMLAVQVREVPESCPKSIKAAAET